MRSWPRTPANDRYKFAAENLTKHLEKTLGLQVLVGNNEFCVPSLEETFEEAAKKEAERVIVITNMLTQ